MLLLSFQEPLLSNNLLALTTPASSLSSHPQCDHSHVSLASCPVHFSTHHTHITQVRVSMSSTRYDAECLRVSTAALPSRLRQLRDCVYSVHRRVPIFEEHLMNTYLFILSDQVAVAIMNGGGQRRVCVDDRQLTPQHNLPGLARGGGAICGA
ncbi:hypothetical protein J3A83DRAFT_2773747 [Scleroderma citrinum]